MQRHRKRKNEADESTEPDYEQSGRDEFKKTTVFIAVIDHLIDELDRRYHSYKDIQQTFGFLNEIPSIPLQVLHTGAVNLQKKEERKRGHLSKVTAATYKSKETTISVSKC